MKLQIPSPAVRRYVYLVALAALALLVGYHLIDPGKVPLWVELVGAVLGMAAPTVSLPAVNQKIAETKR